MKENHEIRVIGELLSRKNYYPKRDIIMEQSWIEYAIFIIEDMHVSGILLMMMNCFLNVTDLLKNMVLT